MRSTSLLTLPVTLPWLAGSAYGHAIRRTSVGLLALLSLRATADALLYYLRFKALISIR
jgi:hypothetical protein